METFDSIDTLWAYRTHTDSIPVAPNHHNGADMYPKQRVTPNYSWVIIEFYHILDHPLQNSSIMQEIVNTCISVCSVVFIIVSTIFVAILSIILVMIKNIVLTKELRSHIKMVKKIKESDWEHEPSHC